MRRFFFVFQLSFYTSTHQLLNSSFLCIVMIDRDLRFERSHRSRKFSRFQFINNITSFEWIELIFSSSLCLFCSKHILELQFDCAHDNSASIKCRECIRKHESCASMKSFFININHQLNYCFKFQFRLIAQYNVFWTKQLRYLVWSIWISLESIILIELIKNISFDFRYENDVVVKLERTITWKNSMSWWLLSDKLLRSMSWFDETKICKFCFRRKKIICQKTKCSFL
jgi:hypothetical protein